MQLQQSELVQLIRRLLTKSSIRKLVSLLILRDAKDTILKYSMGDWDIFCRSDKLNASTVSADLNVHHFEPRGFAETQVGADQKP